MQSFYDITPVDVSPATGAWRDVDLSAHIPEGATGALFHVVNTTPGGDLAIGLRKKGSVNNYIYDAYRNSHFWAAIGVDANRIVNIYIEHAGEKVYLTGYTMAGVTFFTDAVDKTLAGTGAWTDIDCSAEAPGAKALIFEIFNTASYSYGLRNNGSADNRKASTIHSWAIVGCDAAQICEGYRSGTTVYFKLVGYITGGVTFNVNATDKSLEATGAYTDLAALPSGSAFGFFEIYCTSAYAYALRKNGSAEDIYYDCRMHYHAIMPCDSSRLIEGKIENTNVDFFLLGTARENVYKDISSRFYLSPPYIDIATRFDLDEPFFKDIATRFYLSVPSGGVATSVASKMVSAGLL